MTDELRLSETHLLSDREKLAVSLRVQGFTLRFIASKIPKVKGSKPALRHVGYSAGDIGVNIPAAKKILYRAARKLNKIDFQSKRFKDLISESMRRKV